MTIGRSPAGPARGIGADDMIVGKNMQKSEFFGRLGIIFDRGRIAADFSLGKDNSDTHGTHSL